MKVCFYGSSGHAHTTFPSKPLLPHVQYAAYCPGYPGEDQGKFLSGCAQNNIRLRRYENLERMLDTEKPHVLVVDNRFTQRAQAETEAMNRGIHVYADKPAAISLSEITTLYNCSAENNVHLWTMHTVRYNPWYYTAKALVDQGAIGRVRMVNCRKSYQLGVRRDFYRERRYYGGTALWVSIHAIDMIAFVSGLQNGTVCSYQSRADNFGYGDMEIITASNYSFDNDVLASISTDYYRPPIAHSHDDDRMRVVGTRGIVEVQRREGEHEVRLLNETGDGFQPVPQIAPPLIFEDFIHTIEGRGSGILNTKISLANAAVAVFTQQSADSGAPARIEIPDYLL